MPRPYQTNGNHTDKTQILKREPTSSNPKGKEFPRFHSSTQPCGFYPQMELPNKMPCLGLEDLKTSLKWVESRVLVCTSGNLPNKLARHCVAFHFLFLKIHFLFLKKSSGCLELHLIRGERDGHSGAKEASATAGAVSYCLTPKMVHLPERTHGLTQGCFLPLPARVAIVGCHSIRAPMGSPKDAKFDY